MGAESLGLRSVECACVSVSHTMAMEGSSNAEIEGGEGLLCHRSSQKTCSEHVILAHQCRVEMTPLRSPVVLDLPMSFFARAQFAKRSSNFFYDRVEVVRLDPANRHRILQSGWKP